MSSKPSRSRSSLCHEEDGSVAVGYSEVTDALEVGQVETVHEPVCAVSIRTSGVGLYHFSFFFFFFDLPS